MEQHLALVVLGLIAAALGVGAMRAAAMVERGFQAAGCRSGRGRSPEACRRAFASFTPQALGAGHGAIGLDIPRAFGAVALAALILVKLTACLVSLASGFRGGLFFASLFVGALLGKLYALASRRCLPGFALDPTACIFAGMGTLGVAIVGGPLTMTFLVLESSGDLAVAGGVLAACIASSLAVRISFGYSFSTWRLHLRGENIRGAQDIGWQRELTVARLMDRDPARRARRRRSPNSAPPIRSAAPISSRWKMKSGATPGWCRFRRLTPKVPAPERPSMNSLGSREATLAPGNERQGGVGAVRDGAVGNPRRGRPREFRAAGHAWRSLYGAALRRSASLWPRGECSTRVRTGKGR